MIEQAFLLAAGFGTRMLPLTKALPKPLLPIAGRPLLGLHLDNLAGLGLARVAINTHHLAGQIQEFIAARSQGPEVVLLHEEPEILGTGGGLAGAGRALGLIDSQKPLLVINSDVVFDFDLQEIITAHRASGADVSMVLADVPGLNQVGIEGQRITGFRDSASGQKLAYLSVQVVEPSVFSYLPQSGPGDLIQAYRALLADGYFIRGHVLSGNFFWANVDAPDLYLDIHRRMLSRGASALGWSPAGPVFLAPGAAIKTGAEISGFASLSTGAVVEAGAKVVDSVLLAGAVIATGAKIEGCIVGPGVRVTNSHRAAVLAGE